MLSGAVSLTLRFLTAGLLIFPSQVYLDINTVNEAPYCEALNELDRQIELIQQFLVQRKNLGARDTDLQSKLRVCIKERDELIAVMEDLQQKRIAS